jgi:hypothetical protein
MDPDAGLVGVLLTNRVHPTRASLAIRLARPAAYDAMAATMETETETEMEMSSFDRRDPHERGPGSR